MARLTDQLGSLLARVELLARGAEGHRAAAERALEQKRPWEAREHALCILEEVPRSRVGLALWAEAADAALLDHEAAEAWERLTRELPFRSDVWLQLGEARVRLGQTATDALLRAAEMGDPPAAADAARLALCDSDLDEHDLGRAERWLDQLSLGGRAAAAAAWRRLRLGLERGDIEAARRAAAECPDPAPLEGPAWLLRARLAIRIREGDAWGALRRALLLDAPGALGVAGEWIAAGADEAARAALKELVEDLGVGSHPLIRAAFATAEGRPRDALSALADGARTDRSLLDEYLMRALEVRDEAALGDAAKLFADSRRAMAPEITALLQAITQSSAEARLGALDGAAGRASIWAESLRQEVYRRWWSAPVCWRELCAELTSLGNRLSVPEVARDADGVLRDVDRPLRVAIVGEFNAGKSSLINALLGEQVAPVGVLPTTATVNHLVWAPDRFARVERRDGQPDRLVPHADLEATLAEVGPGNIERVTLFAPLELLRKVELIDTPGFNAPDAEHARLAREIYGEVHVAVWLLDATQPLKASERDVLGEIVREGLPLVVLLNKIDRLPDVAAVEQIRAHVQAGLEEHGIVPEAPVTPFSARRALAARRGDASCLASSRWADVEALVEGTLVEKSALLRDRALRHRVAELAARIAKSAEGAAAKSREQAGLRAEERQRLSDLSKDVAGDRGGAVRRAEPAIAACARTFVAEVLPVAGILADSGARRFVEERARRDLGPAWATAVGELLGCPESLLEALVCRYQALAAARAVELVASAKDVGLEDHLRDLAALAVDEIGHAAEQSRSRLVDPPEEPVWVRASSLATVIHGRPA